MPVDFDTDFLNVIGAQIATIGDLIGAVAAQKEAIQDEAEKNDVEKLTFLSALLVLTGDTISFIAAVMEFQESGNGNDANKKMDSDEEEKQKLGIFGALLNVAGDVLELKASV